jgi:hypothetical protein
MTNLELTTVANQLHARYTVGESHLVITQGTDTLLDQKGITEPQDHWNTVAVNGTTYDVNLYQPIDDVWTLALYPLKEDEKGSTYTDTAHFERIELDVM